MHIIADRPLIFRSNDNAQTFAVKPQPGPQEVPDWVRDTKMFEMASKPYKTPKFPDADGVEYPASVLEVVIRAAAVEQAVAEEPEAAKAKSKAKAAEN